MKCLETARLYIRELSIEDAPAMFEYAQDERVYLNTLWNRHESLEETRSVINLLNQAPYNWALEYKENGKMIGTIGLKILSDKGYELGYALNPSYWGQGLMSESVKKILQFAFLINNVEYVNVRHLDFNEKSKKVIQRCHFRFVEETPDYKNNCNVLCYSMTKAEYDTLYDEGKL